MARDPDDQDVIACEILAEHFVIVWSLHPDAKASLGAALLTVAKEWLEDNSDEYRNSMGDT